MLECVVINPGALPTTAFQQVGPGHWVCDIGLLRSTRLTVALTHAGALPESHALALYLRTKAEASTTVRQDFETDFTFIGHISNRIPSASLPVPVTLLHADSPVRGLLGIALEPQETISNIVNVHEGDEATTRAIAERIAKDFAAHVLSYATELRQGVEVVCFPIASIQKWLQRVVQRMGAG